MTTEITSPLLMWQHILDFLSSPPCFALIRLETDDYQLRPKPNRIFNDTARLQISQSSSNIDGARIWNNASTEIHNAATLSEAKTKIKKLCKSLPI